MQCLVISIGLTDAVIEQVKGENPEIQFNRRVKVNIEARQKSDAAENRYKVE